MIENKTAAAADDEKVKMVPLNLVTPTISAFHIILYLRLSKTLFKVMSNPLANVQSMKSENAAHRMCGSPAKPVTKRLRKS